MRTKTGRIAIVSWM